MRRKADNAFSINLSKILRMELNDLDFQGKDILEIRNDVNSEISDFSALNYYCAKYKIKSISLLNLTINQHKKFLETINLSGVSVDVSIKDAPISKIYEEFNPTKETIINEINEENITKIYNKDRHKIVNGGVLSPNKMPYYNNIFLSNDDFLRAIDILAYEISKYAKTDIEKVVLVNKIIKENLIFDWECSNESKHKKIDEVYIPKDSFNRKHIGHFVQSVFTRKKVVCSAIATFASILLNHPLLNIKIKYMDDESVISEHAWNNVKIGNIWYSCDFTWSLTRDSQNELKYVLIKARSKNNVNDDSNFYSDCDYNRIDLKKVQEKFKDVHITIPKLPMINKHLIERPTTISTRRPIVNTISNPVRRTAKVVELQKRRKGIKL